MITFETIEQLESATLQEDDLVQVLGEFSEGDVALMTGKVYPPLHTSSNRIVTIQGGLQVEIFPTPLGDKDVTKKYVNQQDDKIKASVNNLHTKREAIEYVAGLKVTDPLHLYVYNGIEYLPKVSEVPFITGAGFDSDKFELSLKFQQWRNIGDIRGWGADPNGIVDSSDAIIKASLDQSKLLFPDGSYKISKQITTNSNWKFTKNAKLVVDQPIEDLILIKPEYTPIKLNQGDITIAEFTKYATKLSRLDNYKNHLMIVDSNQLDFNRNHASGQTYRKCALSVISEKGRLNYPLTTTFNSITNITLTPINIPKITIEGLTIEITGSPTSPKNLISVERNCVAFKDLRYIDSTGNTGQIDLTSFVSASNVYDLSFDGVFCDALSDGKLDYNYTILTWKVLKLSINDLNSFDGWAQLDGNYTRDVTVSNSTIDRIGGHYSFWDCTFENITAVKSRAIDLSGGGRLDIKNLKVTLNTDFLEINNLYAVSIRGDYAGEWDGDVFINGVTINAQSIKVLSQDTIFNVFESFCDSSSKSFNYGRKTQLAKSITIKNCAMLINPDVNYKWILRGCAVGYVGAPSSDAQYPYNIDIENISLIGQSATKYHQVKALDWFGDVKPPTNTQSCKINISKVNNSNPIKSGSNPSGGIIEQLPSIALLNNSNKMSLKISVNNCQWLKVYSNGHEGNITQINVSNSSLYYIGGDSGSMYTLDNCQYFDTRFEGTWKGIINGGWFNETTKVDGTTTSTIGFPNKIEQNLLAIGNVFIHKNTTMTTDIHNQYTIFEGKTNENYWKSTIRSGYRAGAQSGNFSEVTPMYIGEEYLDNASGFYNWWKATGTAKGNWKQIS